MREMYQVRMCKYGYEIFSSKSEYAGTWEEAVRMLCRLRMIYNNT